MSRASIHDKPIPEDAEIRAAFPTLTGRHDLYTEALRMVGAKHSKAALVALVNWLLKERADRDTKLQVWRDIAKGSGL